jgi:hypothetical protein
LCRATPASGSERSFLIEGRNLIDGSTIPRALTIFGANYVKRWLETGYDRAFDTPFGQHLRSLDGPTRYAVEFGLNVLAVFFDRALVADTELKRLVKEIGEDAFPEISKRIINHATKVDDVALAEVLLALERPQLLRLLNWLYETPEQSRGEAFTLLTGMIWRKLDGATESTETEEAEDDRLPSSPPSAGSWPGRVEEAIQQASDDLKKLREELRARRLGRRDE